MKWLLNKDLKEVKELAIHLYGRKVLPTGRRGNAKTQSGCAWHVLGTSRRLASVAGLNRTQGWRIVGDEVRKLMGTFLYRASSVMVRTSAFTLCEGPLEGF